MILPISNQVFWTYVAVPVWQREPAPQAAAAPPAACDAGAGPTAASPAPEPRLVFLGYEWRPVARWDPFVNPGFDHWVDNDPDEVRERALRADRERRQDLTGDAARRAETATVATTDPAEAAGRGDAVGVPPVAGAGVAPEAR